MLISRFMFSSLWGIWGGGGSCSAHCGESRGGHVQLTVGNLGGSCSAHCEESGGSCSAHCGESGGGSCSAHCGESGGVMFSSL